MSSPTHIFLAYYLPVAIWAALIFTLSLSTFSGNFTLNLLRAVLELLDLDVSRRVILQWNAVLREVAHLSEYFVFATLLWRAVKKEASRSWDLGAALVTLGIVAALASADETVQLFRHLRTGSMTDVLVDTTGGLLALAALYLWTQKGPATQT